VSVLAAGEWGSVGSHAEAEGVRKRVWAPRLAVDGTTGLSEAVFAPGGAIEVHSHPSKTEVFKCSTRGSSVGEFTVEKSAGDTEVVAVDVDGVAIVVPTGAPHGLRNTGSVDVYCLYFGLV
jgi:oxalate decarboxylase/phosphoglucose isomerase-like protein (cupin superfamily)